MPVLWVCVLPVLTLATVLSAALMFAQPGRRITAGQARLQVACWVCRFVAGLAFPDGYGHAHEDIPVGMRGRTPQATTRSGQVFLAAGIAWGR